MGIWKFAIQLAWLISAGTQTTNPVPVMINADHAYALPSVGEEFHANFHILDLSLSGQLVYIHSRVGSVDMHDRRVAGPTNTDNRQDGKR